MCSIAGIYNLKNNSNIDKIVLEKMSSMLKHRGPDHSDLYISQNVGFAHNRLNILDLNSRSNQPFQAYGKVLVFNGIIYNYEEIRETLKQKGYAFQTTGDTEVVLAAFNVYGPNCVSLFNGMWAFAIYDTKDGSLFLSRDRFGIKPLYYTITNDQFYFASEQKAFERIPGFKYSLNHIKFEEFVSTGAIEYDKETLFSNISQLPAGHNLFISNFSSKPSIQPYYTINTTEYLGSYEDAKIQFKTLLQNSIQKRLKADVNIGITLSGGIDSNSILSLIKESNRKEIYSISSADPHDDKSEYTLIKAASSFHNIENFHVAPDLDVFLNSFETLTKTQELPVLSTSIFAQHQVYELAKRKNLSVCLSGQGADESLMGYDLFVKQQILNNPLRFILSPSKWFYLTKSRNSSIPTNQLINKSFLTFVEDNSSFNKNNLSDISQEMFSKSVLPSLLHFEDRNSMHFAIESRLPFLDYQLVDFIFSLKDSWKIGKFERKKILKDVMKADLPKTVFNNKRKFAFYSPTKPWLQTIDFTSLGLSEIIERHHKIINPIKSKDSQEVLFKKWSIAKWLDSFNVDYL